MLYAWRESVNRLAADVLAVHNPGMSRKTQLIIEATAELFFAGYCSLAFLAWFAKAVLFSSQQSAFSPMLILWASLAVGSFVLYGRTRRKMKALAAEEKEQEAKEMLLKALEGNEPQAKAGVRKELHSN